MTAQAQHLALGTSGEAAAKAYLERLGWRIDAANWRPAGAARGLELDLVARDGKEIVFVEVKTRSGPGRGSNPLHVPVAGAFTPEKQRKTALAARHYLAAHSFWDQPCRFDLICLEQSAQDGFTLEHHRNVIDLGHLVDSGDAAWQPW